MEEAMKSIFAFACILGLVAAAHGVARDPVEATEEADATTEIIRELESAIEAKTLVRVVADGHEWYGVPTHISTSTVSLQMGDKQLRSVVRLNSVVGVELTNTPEETKAAVELLKKAYENAFPIHKNEPAGVRLPKITGTVSLNGKPLAGAQITFSTGDVQFIALTRVDGSYDTPVTTDLGVLPVGKYRVSIAWPRNKTGTVEIPERYQGDSSALTVEVQEGENTFDISLESK
jgi:hypothetical protein